MLYRFNAQLYVLTRDTSVVNGQLALYAINSDGSNPTLNQIIDTYDGSVDNCGGYGGLVEDNGNYLCVYYRKASYQVHPYIAERTITL